jgi:hypothetical protein
MDEKPIHIDKNDARLFVEKFKNFEKIEIQEEYNMDFALNWISDIYEIAKKLNSLSEINYEHIDMLKNLNFNYRKISNYIRYVSI